MGTWVNEDGLRVVLGTDEATPGKAGTVYDGGNKHVAEVEFDLTDLNTSTDTILDYNVVVPKNARIEAVEVITVTAANSAGDAATLDLGLIKTSDYTDDIDQNGLVATGLQASMDPAGDKQILTTGGVAGALIGTTLTENGVISGKAGTEAFTAGRIRVRVIYFFL
jgi:hypothetical protein